MADRALDALRSLPDLVGSLGAELAVCERQCGDLRTRLRELQSVMARMKTPSPALFPELERYAITVNGKRRMALGDAAERFRRTWRGDFLLDVPRRALRVRKGSKVREFHLGQDLTHRGVERVLQRGLSRPGQSFGHLCIPSRTGNDRSIGAPVLSRYVLTIRRMIGDSGRRPVYLLTADVDHSFSDTCRGYVFSGRWRCAVIERLAFGKSEIHGGESCR